MNLGNIEHRTSNSQHPWNRSGLSHGYGVPPLGGPEQLKPAKAGTPNVRFMVPMHAQTRMGLSMNRSSADSLVCRIAGCQPATFRISRRSPGWRRSADWQSAIRQVGGNLRYLRKGESGLPMR